MFFGFGNMNSTAHGVPNKRRGRKMEKANLSKEQIKDILNDTQARRKQFIEKAKELSESGEHKKAQEYCKAVSDLSGQIVRFYEMYMAA